MRRPTIDPLARRSARLFACFRWYARRYLSRGFHAMRMSRSGAPPTLIGPCIIVLNHPSWWDPLVCLELTRSFPERLHSAPMDSVALGRYRFFARLGFFPVEAGTRRGAADFLSGSLAVLSREEGTLWVTAQGRFADVRERPVRILPGVGHLAHRLAPASEHGSVLPLALEYAHWEERLSEVFVHFGTPLSLTRRRSSAEAWTREIELALESAQDELAAEVRGRDPAAFETRLSGRRGVGGIYDLWRAWVARLRGEAFDPGHGRRPEP